MPAPCWAVVAHDTNGQLNVIADLGLTPNLGPSLWTSANWVFRHGVEFASRDLTQDSRATPGAAGTALAFPLICRHKTVGALVGLDPDPSTAAPALGAALVAAACTVLEPAAIALDNATALQKAEALSVTDDLTRPATTAATSTRRSAARPNGPRAAAARCRCCSSTWTGSRWSTTTMAIWPGARRRRNRRNRPGCARETDAAVRGDEFALILPDTGREGVSVAARIRDRVGAAQFLASDGLSVHLTVSIGVATLPDSAGSAEELLRAADAAIYRVKASGKNGIQAFAVSEL